MICSIYKYYPIYYLLNECIDYVLNIAYDILYTIHYIQLYVIWNESTLNYIILQYNRLYYIFNIVIWYEIRSYSIILINYIYINY
jgi:hypothetical protein